MEPKSNISLYGRYILEREGKSIVEIPEGYATYSFHKGFVYVEDVYILPEYREKGFASGLVDVISREAIKKGYSSILTTVSPKAKGSTESLKAVLGYGFELKESDQELIYFIKEIK